jgi:hypothetical protein
MDKPSVNQPLLPVPAPDAQNRLQTLADLQRALADAAALGYFDNTAQGTGKPRRTGFLVAKRLCAPGAWTKRFERYLKFAYLAGFDHASLIGEGIARKSRKRL